MRLLADENIPLPSVDALVEAGFDVLCVARESPGVTDRSVLARARAERRLLVTFDRDFGELIFARGVPGVPGVIFLRFAPRSPTEPAELLAGIAARPGLTFDGRFTMVDRDHVRQRQLLIG